MKAKMLLVVEVDLSPKDHGNVDFHEAVQWTVNSFLDDLDDLKDKYKITRLDRPTDQELAAFAAKGNILGCR